MASFSKEMMGRCSQTLKFVNPFTEKYVNPDYVMPEADVQELLRKMQSIVDLYMESTPAVQQEFRMVADDVDGLNRLQDLIHRSQDKVIRIDMKTTVNDVQKRCVGIKVILNRSLGTAPKKSPLGCILAVILILAVGWFLKGKIFSWTATLKEKAETAVEAAKDGISDLQKTPEETAVEENSAVTPEEKTDTASDAETEAKSEKESSADTHEAAEPEEKPQKERVLPTGETKKKRTIRTWTDVQGGKRKARFLYMKNDIVFLEYRSKQNGWTEEGFRIENFSPKDKDYITSELEKMLTESENSEESEYSEEK